MFFVTFLRVSLALSIFHPKNRASFVSLIKSYRSSLELLYHNYMYNTIRPTLRS